MKHALASRNIGSWLQATVCSMVDFPWLVRVVDRSSDLNRSAFHIYVPAEDMSKVIGSGGRNIHAIRRLLDSISGKYDHPSTLHLPVTKQCYAAKNRGKNV